MRTRQVIACPSLRRPDSESGMATVVLIALLGIMLVLVTGATSALWHLKRDLQLIEQQQHQAWSEGRMPLRSPTLTESSASRAAFAPLPTTETTD